MKQRRFLIGELIINNTDSFYHLLLSPADLMGSKSMWRINSEAVGMAITPELPNESIYYETILNRPPRKA